MESRLFLERLHQSLSEGLPGELAHQIVMPLKRPLSSAAKKESTDFRESAVGIILYPFNKSINCILIRRPSYDGAHSGQISFPGGKRDQGDEDLVFTARRECEEEIAVPHDHLRLIHPLTEVFIPVSKFLVQPYVFYTEQIPTLIPDQREVEEIIHFDVFELTKKADVKRISIPINSGLTLKDVPYFEINGHVVWGATAMMLAEMKVLLDRM